MEDISGPKQDATSGELSAVVLSRPAMLEHFMKGTNSKHEKPTILHIKLAYKISAFAPLAVSHLHVYKGPWKRYDISEWQEW